MKLPDQLGTQVRDLWAYYPGRHRAAILWLFLVPLLYIAYSTMVFLRFSRGEADIPYPLYVLAGQTLCWIAELAVIVLVLRVAHSSRTSWRESFTIMWSSAFYAMLIVAPVIPMVWALLVFYGAASFLGVLQVICGFVLFTGAYVVLVAVACVLAHRLGFFVPLLLLLAFHTFPILFGVIYSAHGVPDGWQYVLDFVVPAGPAIRIFRAGLCGFPAIPLSWWAGAVLHAAIGYWLAIRLWQMIQAEEVRP
jgi:hypothetical protein